ncbi:kinase-like domain-containing protein, partial [Phyllosticta citribraziliensis]
MATLALVSDDITPAVSRPISGGKGRATYTIDRPLGQGGFGVVRRLIDLEDGQVFAVKELIRNSKSQMDQFRKEVEMMMANKHPNVVQVVNFDEAAPKPKLTMEYCPLGSLQTNPPPPTAINGIVSILRQVLMGLDHMHSRQFAHRDLKPENILLRSLSPLSIAIADFGFAKHFSSNMITLCGTPLFTAPEVLSHNYEGPLVDIWSAGITMLCLLRMLPGDPP